MLAVVVRPGDGRALYIARSMPGFRNPSNHCFHCISHNAAGKEIRDSGFPENIRPAIWTDEGFRWSLNDGDSCADIYAIYHRDVPRQIEYPTLFML
ncbi:hypothetical protein [Burkholderia sp. LMG 32019]|uniref:hypothetical protein n=1 Tax=Burkholderia sp. LMG 32019 TaxID=3158173 RepID=UPI003C30E26A